VPINPGTDIIKAKTGTCRFLPKEQILDERGSAQDEHNDSKQKN
jgi:hypothetical protein